MAVIFCGGWQVKSAVQCSLTFIPDRVLHLVFLFCLRLSSLNHAKPLVSRNGRQMRKRVVYELCGSFQFNTICEKVEFLTMLWWLWWRYTKEWWVSYQIPFWLVQQHPLENAQLLFDSGIPRIIYNILQYNKRSLFCGGGNFAILYCFVVSVWFCCLFPKYQRSPKYNQCTHTA